MHPRGGLTCGLVMGHPAPVDVEGARAVGEDVGRDRAREGFAGDDDGLKRGLERGAESVG